MGESGVAGGSQDAAPPFSKLNWGILGVERGGCPLHDIYNGLQCVLLTCKLSKNTLFYEKLVSVPIERARGIVLDVTKQCEIWGLDGSKEPWELLVVVVSCGLIYYIK